MSGALHWWFVWCISWWRNATAITMTCQFSQVTERMQPSSKKFNFQAAKYSLTVTCLGSSGIPLPVFLPVRITSPSAWTSQSQCGHAVIQHVWVQPCLLKTQILHLQYSLRMLISQRPFTMKIAGKAGLRFLPFLLSPANPASPGQSFFFF